MKRRQRPILETIEGHANASVWLEGPWRVCLYRVAGGEVSGFVEDRADCHFLPARYPNYRRAWLAALRTIRKASR